MARVARWVVVGLLSIGGCGGDDEPERDQRCDACGAGQECAQFFDGNCATNRVYCQAVGTGCGSAVPNYAPCGGEIAGALHCYGP